MIIYPFLNKEIDFTVPTPESNIVMGDGLPDEAGAFDYLRVWAYPCMPADPGPSENAVVYMECRRRGEESYIGRIILEARDMDEICQRWLEARA